MELKIDLKEFSRKLRLHDFFLDTTQEPKLVQNKSSFEPPNQRNQELEEIIDKIKNIKIENFIIQRTIFPKLKETLLKNSKKTKI